MSFDQPEPDTEIGGEPADADDKLLELIESWSRADPEAIVESFEEYGEQMLESFLSRHVADLDDGMEQTQRGYLRNLIKYVQTYHR